MDIGLGPSDLRLADVPVLSSTIRIQ